MHVRPATAHDISVINQIYNYFVEHSNSTFDIEPRSIGDAQSWFDEHGTPTRPVLVADDDETVKGWASFSKLSTKWGYDTTAEVSVYVSLEHQRRGIGKRLLQAALDAGDEAGVHCVIARIAGDNQASIRLFESLGFGHVGVEREVGWKFGKFQDIVVMQKLFPANVPSA